MSKPKQSDGEAVIGSGFRPQRSGTLKWLVLSGLLVLLVLTGIILNRYVINPPLSPAQEQAISTADMKSKGFEKQSFGYSFTELNTSITYAYAKKCLESRAVYADVQKHPNGVKEIDMQAYKSKIDQLCPKG